MSGVLKSNEEFEVPCPLALSPRKINYKMYYSASAAINKITTIVKDNNTKYHRLYYLNASSLFFIILEARLEFGAQCQLIWFVVETLFLVC